MDRYLIIQKIQEEKFEELTYEEKDLINKDEELSNIYLDKIRTLSNLTEEITSGFEELMFKYEDTAIKFMDFYRKTNEDDFREILISGDLKKEIKELGVSYDVDKFFSKIINIYEGKLYTDIIDGIDISDKIAEEQVINFIIENKLYQYGFLIYSDNPTKEMELFVIESISKLGNSWKKIYLVTDNIKEYVLNNGYKNLYSSVINVDNEDEISWILDLLNKDIISLKDIGYYNKLYYKIYLSEVYLKKQIENDDDNIIYYDDECIQKIINSEKLFQILIEKIKKRGLLEYKYSKLIEAKPELEFELIKYCYEERYLSLNKSDYQSYAEKIIEDEEKLIKLLNLSKEKLLLSIKESINIEAINKTSLFRKILFSPILREDIENMKSILSLFPDDVVINEFISSLKYQHYEEENNELKILTEILGKRDIKEIKIEESKDKIYNNYYNSEYTIDYKNWPINVIAAIINGMSEEKLSSISIYAISTLEDKEKADKIFKFVVDKLIELKITTLNYKITNYINFENPSPSEKEIIDIITSEENPLGVFYSNIKYLKYSEKGKKVYEKFLNNQKIINVNFFQDLVLNIDIEEFDNIIPKYIKKIYPLDISTYLELEELLRGNDKEKINKLKEILTEFLQDKKEVPLYLSSYFDLDMIERISLTDIDDLKYTKDYLYFDYYIKDEHKKAEIDHLILKKLKERIISKKDVEAYLYYGFHKYEEFDYNLLLSDNVKLDLMNIEKNSLTNTLDFSSELLSDILIKEFETKDEFIIKKLLPQLTYNIIDYNITILIGYLPKYEDTLLEIIEKNLLENKNLNPNILLMYTTGTKEKVDKIIKKIYKQINDTPELSRVLITLGNNEIVDLILDNIIENITQDNIVTITNKFIINFESNPQSFEKYINKINTLEELPSNFINNNTINNNRIKQIILTRIKDKKINISTFNDSYFNIDIVKELILQNNEIVKKYVEYIIHNQINLEKEVDELIFKYIPLVYNIDDKKISIAKKYLGKDIYKYLESEQFKNILKYEEKEIIAFFEIFQNRTLNNIIVDSVNTSLNQHIFAKENSNIVETYQNVMGRIQQGITEKEEAELLIILEQNIPKDFEQKLMNYCKHKNNMQELELYQKNKKEFLLYLIKQCKNKEHDKIYESLIHSIINQYVQNKRIEYEKNGDVIRDTDKIKYKFDKKSLNDNFFNYLVKQNLLYLERLYMGKLYLKRNKELELEEIYEVLEYLNNPSKYNNISIDKLKEIKSKIGKIKLIFYNIMEKYETLPNDYFHLLSEESFIKPIKKVYDIPSYEFKFDEILGKIKIDPFFENVIRNPQKYEALQNLINKYGFLNWGKIFDKQLDKLSIFHENTNLFAFINAFSKIYDVEEQSIAKKRKEIIEIMEMEYVPSEEIEKFKNTPLQPISDSLTPFKIYRYNEIYDSMPNCYKLVMGLEDSIILKANGGTYPSYADAETRLEEGLKLHIEMIAQKEVTIPSFIKDYSTTETKKLRVIVANKADPRNLTQGERTSACMRVLGYAKELFNLCSVDQRGFHITFEDPETHEYVSRVSGYRNGNTVCLNQLRYTCSNKYQTEEIIETAYKVAKDIIKLSKGSEMPIDNVIISNTYAMTGKETTYIEGEFIRNGIYEGYGDVTNNAVILATTSKDEKYAPFKPEPDATKQPKYKIVRIPPVTYLQNEVTTNVLYRMQRVTALKKCLEHKDDIEYYHSIDVNLEMLETEYLSVTIGEDWFVAVDTNNNIISDYIPSREGSYEEMQQTLKEYNEKYVLGGHSNERKN